MGKGKKLAALLRRDGLWGTWQRLHYEHGVLLSRNYFTLSAKERAQQEATHFDTPVRFSIPVPLFNTPLPFLRQMAESVLAQTYPHWELILCDGSTDGSTERQAYIEGLNDARIRYKKLAQNGGIAANTNACLALATGDYIALLDHDDVLHPAALYANARAINTTNADFLYSDEATFTAWGKVNGFHFKPDFDEAALLCNNYICHFTVFSRKLLQKAGGGFKPEFDGSQDHELFLRLTEQAENICHIPHVLYLWRVHAGSVASRIEAKPYAVEAGKRAVHEALLRRAGEGTVFSLDRPTFYTFRLKQTPTFACLTEGEQNGIGFAGAELFSRAAGEPLSHAVHRCMKEMKAENLLILPAGASLSPEAVACLLSADALPRFGIVTGQVLDEKGRILHQGYLLGTRVLTPGMGKAPLPTANLGREGILHRVSVVNTAVCMLNKNAYFSCGGLEENDIDFCRRLTEKGYLCLAAPQAVIRLSGALPERLPNAPGRYTDPFFPRVYKQNKDDFRIDGKRI